MVEIDKKKRYYANLDDEEYLLGITEDSDEREVEEDEFKEILYEEEIEDEDNLDDEDTVDISMDEEHKDEELNQNEVIDKDDIDLIDAPIDNEVVTLTAELEQTEGFENNEKLLDKYYNDKSLSEYQRETLLNDLAKKNIKTIYYIVNRLRSFQNMVSLDEMTSAGLVGYAKAIAKYDPTRGVKFATFAINCIKNEVSFCLRKERKHYDRNISTNYIKHQDKNGNDLTIEDTLKDNRMTPEEQVRHNALRKSILDKLTNLSPLEKYVIIYRYGMDRGIILTQKEIAGIVDMSQANISKIERNCIEKLRILMAVENS